MSDQLGTVAIPCPECGRYLEQTLAWLQAHARARCNNPKCGTVFSLRDKQTRSYLRQLSELAGHGDPRPSR